MKPELLPRVVPVETLRPRLVPICRPSHRLDESPPCRSFLPRSRDGPIPHWVAPHSWRMALRAYNGVGQSSGAGCAGRCGREPADVGREPDRAPADGVGPVAATRSRRGEPMIGLRELALLAVVVLVLYGRSGVLKSRQFQTIWPWIAPVRRSPGRPGGLRTPAADPRHATEIPTSLSPKAKTRPK